MIRVRGMGKIRGAYHDLRITETEIRRRIWQRWHNPEGQTTPVFLVGCGRSGTSMIVRQLCKSWRLKLYNEDNPAAFVRWRLRDLSTIEELIEKSHAEITIFKPILDTYRTRVLLAQFPAGRFIFAFRHYDDVINSSLKRFEVDNRIRHVRAWMEEDFSEYADQPPPEQTKAFIRSLWKPSLGPKDGAALYWLFQNRLYYDLFLDKEERVKLVGYESVVLNPEEKFRSLCDFLGVDFEPHITEGVFSTSISRNNPPKFDSDIRAACEKLWQRLCRDMGADPHKS